MIQIFNFTGLVLNLAGTIILAISLSKYLTTLHGAIVIHDMSLKGLINRDSEVLKTDSLGDFLKIGVKSSALRTKIGLGLISVGFIMQLIPFFICVICNLPKC